MTRLVVVMMMRMRMVTVVVYSMVVMNEDLGDCGDVQHGLQLGE